LDFFTLRSATEGTDRRREVSKHRGLGDLYIADVGANQFEEVNLGQVGANFGWPVFEGPPGSSPPTVAPIHFYSHSVGQSITGGYVYRGEAEALQGQYFFADFVQGKVFTLRFNGTAWVATDRTAQITEDFGTVGNVSSFGEDARGNLYLVDFDGDVFRLTPAVASADQADVLRGLGGNDLLFGGSGNDTVDGGPGADTLTGGQGDDILKFGPQGGADTVTDFVAGAGSVDRIDLRTVVDVRSVSDVLARANQVGADTVINFGNGER
jgi:Ca2+-binding RTX toxin-like protein